MSTIPTQEDLNKIPYGEELKKKFEELGVPELWKPGSKKAVMITKVIEKLSLKKSLENAGVPDDKVEEAIEEKEMKRQVIEANVKTAEELEAEKQKAAALKKLKAKKLTQEEIKQNIENIDRNLLNNIPSQREILLQKKKELLLLLE